MWVVGAAWAVRAVTSGRTELRLGHRRPKDLRDIYASQLLTAGVQLGYVSQQLGRANVAMTAQHYAHWAGEDAYRRPLEVQDGGVPADLLKRIAGREDALQDHVEEWFL